jgi:hypothetical protein
MQILIKTTVNPSRSHCNRDFGKLKPGTVVQATLVEALPRAPEYARIVTAENDTLCIPWTTFAIVVESKFGGGFACPGGCAGGWVFARGPIDGGLLDGPIPCSRC